ncbi:hypothetical protein TUM20983_10450 [Mycobacterium antarcticum]|uniref:sensor domain-containing protein n=1 Tax=Mycolicibacterium sp. TUM20983 TaxID=3023369 RepID=UPI002394FF2D|nr:diguanylate cyclase [Mycolicibacterium sp. TUM20983]GLP73935.1 hypothetical protein TUM20983_10450 [Mycolicibacterium sp. TUM20983]
MVCTAGKGSADVGPDAAALFQQRFVRLAEMSSDGICVHQDGRIVFANPAAVRWMGVDPAVGLIGRRLTEFVHADSMTAVERRLDGLQRDGDSSRPSEVVMGRPQGSARDVEATSMRVEWDGRPAVVTNFRDLTTVKTAAVLKYQAALLDHVSDAVIGVSPSGEVTSWNAAAEIIYGHTAAQVLGRAVNDAIGVPVDAEQLSTRGGALHTTHVAADGSPRAVRVSAAVTDGGYVLVCADLTALRRAERHFEAVVTAMDAGIAVFSGDGVMESANPTAWRIFEGITKSDAPFAADIPLFDAEGRPIAPPDNPLRQAVESGIPQTERTIGIDRADGHRVWLSVSVRLLAPDHPGHSQVLCTFVDVTAQKLVSERLAHAVDHDPLTGLPNRSHALTRLTASLAPEAETRVSAVLFIDMDGVKLINDSYGHSAGDVVLTTAATRMGDALRDGDVIARLAGDEFVVLLFDCIDRPGIDRLVGDLHRAASKPIRYRKAEITITASIGVAAVVSYDARDASELLAAADAAMYAAKASGPGQTRHAP